jgi:hypothetical protein
MKHFFVWVVAITICFLCSFNSKSLASDHGYHGQLLCECNDSECIQQRFHQHTKETGICLAGLALEAPFPGHGSKIAKILKCGIDSGITIYELIERLQHCEAAKKREDETKTTFSLDMLAHCIAGGMASSAQITQQIIACTADLETGSAIVSCGLNIASGIVKVGDNSVCLAGDLKNLHQSKTELTHALKKTLKARAPRGIGHEGRACNGEENQCNTFAMGKFGIWLGQQSYWSYATRSFLCADTCGNRGRGALECKTNSKEIFGEDHAHCSPLCKTAQCKPAIEQCVSYCCGQDGSCVKSAHDKMIYYKLD